VVEASNKPSQTARTSFRQRLMAVGGAWAALALAAATLPAAAGAALTKAGAWYFPSDPVLAPPSVDVAIDHTASAAGTPAQAGDIFLAPIKNYSLPAPFVGKPGPEILEPNGNVVWEDPLGRPLLVGKTHYIELAMDFHPDVYENHPVLIWWQGYITVNGFGDGVWMIANQHYQVIAEIHAPPHYELDFHDLVLTPQGDAYILANKTVKISLHCCGGPTNGELYDQVLFEIEVKTGKVLWSWDPLQHVRLKESYAGIPKGQPWDPYHLNSVSFGPAGAPIVSARNTWAAYWINRATGAVFARLGGKNPTFKFGPGARFAWQHDVSQQPNEQISVFDDEAAPPVGKQSRGLLLALNWKTHTATVVKQYLLPHPALAGSQGNVERLANSNLFVGWGQLPYLSEYTPSGQLLYFASLVGPDESYRTYRAPWTGEPTYPPSVVATTEKNGVNVGASWNGATTVVAWQLLAGPSPVALTPVGGPVAKSGFETVIHTNDTQPYYAVEALGANGQLLATSPAVAANGHPA